MANNKKKKVINKNNNKAKKPNNEFVMKVCVILGVIFLSLSIIYLMKYFFVEKSYIKINISTDKKVESLVVDNKEEIIATQNYISDLNYEMRYDVDEFKVFKYKGQDIYKNLNNEKILVVVEKSTIPSNCTNTHLDTEYNNCYVEVDDYTENYYISSNGITYKITIKSEDNKNYDSGIKARINYMLSSFKLTNENF